VKLFIQYNRRLPIFNAFIENKTIQVKLVFSRTVEVKNLTARYQRRLLDGDSPRISLLFH
jgi:hypothetical protein